MAYITLGVIRHFFRLIFLGWAVNVNTPQIFDVPFFSRVVICDSERIQMFDTSLFFYCCRYLMLYFYYVLMSPNIKLIKKLFQRSQINKKLISQTVRLAYSTQYYWFTDMLYYREYFCRCTEPWRSTPVRSNLFSLAINGCLLNDVSCRSINWRSAL